VNLWIRLDILHERRERRKDEFFEIGGSTIPIIPSAEDDYNHLINDEFH